MADFATALETFRAECLSRRIANVGAMAEHCDYGMVIQGGAKFAKVVYTEVSKKDGQNVGGCVHCFVAKADGSSKALGSYKAGDVLKAAGWKTPARGARGNIFDDNNGLGRMGTYGPGYNR